MINLLCQQLAIIDQRSSRMYVFCAVVNVLSVFCIMNRPVAPPGFCYRGEVSNSGGSEVWVGGLEY